MLKPLLFLSTLALRLLPVMSMGSGQPTGMVQTGDGISLNFTQTGPRDGQQILFIPGWRQTAAQWKKQQGYFAEAGFRVTTYDMRGHGESEEPDFGYRISRFATDLNDVLEELHLSDVTIVGHSMGCSVAWAWWDQYPHSHNLISNFVFVDQASLMVANPQWTDEQAAALAAIFTPEALYDLANNLDTQATGLLQGMFTDSISESDFEWVLEQNAKMSSAHASALLLDHAFRDWRDVLPRIDVPSLVLAGEASVFPHAGIEWVASQIPGAEQYTISVEEKGSHFSFWENPEKFNSLVEDFISK